MKRDTWHDRAISRQISRRFVAIELDAQRNAQTLTQLSVPAFPTTLVASPVGKVVSHRVGYQSPDEMLALLGDAENYRER
jgi:hypothetical protein